PPRGEEGTARIELLDAVVARIRDVDAPAPVGRHAKGTAELSVARAETPPRGEEGAARIELLDAVVVRIGDVDVPAPVGCHAVGEVELAVTRARNAPHQNERTGGLRGRGRAAGGGASGGRAEDGGGGAREDGGGGARGEGGAARRCRDGGGARRRARRGRGGGGGRGAIREPRLHRTGAGPRLALVEDRRLAGLEGRARQARASGGDLLRARLRAANRRRRVGAGDKDARPERDSSQRDNCSPSHRRAPLMAVPILRLISALYPRVPLVRPAWH